METHKLSDIQIKVCIAPKRVRWPESGTSITWTKAHDCVDALQDLVHNVDLDCVHAEQDKELSAGAIRRRRADLCNQTIRELVNFRPFEVAEKAVTDNISALESLRERDPQQVQMHQKLTQALRDLREGIEATKRMVQERCRTHERSALKSV